MSQPWFFMKHFRTASTKDEITFELDRTVLYQPEAGLFSTTFKIDYVYRVKGIEIPDDCVICYKRDIEVVESVTFKVSRFSSKKHQLETEISFYEVRMSVPVDMKKKILTFFDGHQTKNKILNRVC